MKEHEALKKIFVTRETLTLVEVFWSFYKKTIIKKQIRLLNFKKQSH